MFLLIHFVFTALLSFPAVAQVLSYPTNPVFTTSGTSRDIPLSIATPSWTLNQSTNDAATMQIHSLIGDNGSGSAAAGWENSLQRLRVGTNFVWHTGSFIWKFQLPTGETTTGGNVTADIRFIGTPSTQKNGLWLGISGTFVPNIGLTNFNNVDFTQVGLADNSNSFGVYGETWSLAVPSGLSTFYVAFAKVSDSGALNELVSMNVNITAIPEPSTLALIGATVVAVLLLRLKRNFVV